MSFSMTLQGWEGSQVFTGGGGKRKISIGGTFWFTVRVVQIQFSGLNNSKHSVITETGRVLKKSDMRRLKSSVLNMWSSKCLVRTSMWKIPGGGFLYNSSAKRAPDLGVICLEVMADARVRVWARSIGRDLSCGGKCTQHRPQEMPIFSYVGQKEKMMGGDL